MRTPGRLVGLRAMFVGAGIFAAIGTIVLATLTWGSTSVQWNGASAHGTETGGIVYWTYRGQSYSIPDDAKLNSTTVYFDPKDPQGTAMLDNPAERGLEVAAFAVPCTIAVGIIGFGLVRRVRWRRQSEQAQDTGFGAGIDSAVAQRILAKRAAAATRRPPPRR